MNFPTIYNPNFTDFTNSGDRIVQLYTPALNADGRIDLVESGKHNLYADIQSHKESVDIKVILERFERGDMNVLNRRSGLYLDVTDMPKTYAEMYQRIMDAEAQFMALPVDVREKFNHSPQEFFASIGTQKWFDIFGQPAQKNDDNVPAVTPDPPKGDE